MSVRGWCPTLHEPMLAKDGWLVRVKPPGGRLRAEAARLIAACARRDGNGQIELTARGNLQLRGLRPDTLARFRDAMIAAELAASPPFAERQRVVQIPPFAGSTTQALAASLEAALVAEDFYLPGKFACVVDGGESPGLDGIRADLRLRRVDDRWLIALDGGTEAAHADEPIAAVLRLIQAAAPNRVRGQDRAVLFAAASLTADGRLPASEPHPAPVGRLADGFGFGVAFGMLDVDILARLAACADAATGVLLPTPWRAIIVPGLATAPGDLLITDPRDPRLRIDTCVGRDGCAAASSDTRADAAMLAHAPFRGRLHVAGCAKGCAHPHAADHTLVATAYGYDLVRAGRADGIPVRTGLDLRQAAHAIAQGAA